jgi:hypothetical protein
MRFPVWWEEPQEILEIVLRHYGKRISVPKLVHFSPLLGIRSGLLPIPFAESRTMPISEFLTRWSEPEILRQSVIMGGPPPT